MGCKYTLLSLLTPKSEPGLGLRLTDFGEGYSPIRSCRVAFELIQNEHRHPQMVLELEGLLKGLFLRGESILVWPWLAVAAGRTCSTVSFIFPYLRD